MQQKRDLKNLRKRNEARKGLAVIKCLLFGILSLMNVVFQFKGVSFIRHASF